jgi:thiosulfate sulfurtransferase
MQTMKDFLDKTDPEAALVVYCYHGNSSQGATDYLLEQGFKNVRSLNGGFESWRAIHQDRVERGIASP